MKTNVLPTRKMDPRSPRVTRKRTRVIQLIVSSNVVKTTCVTLETTNKWSAGCCCCCMCYACKLCLYNIYTTLNALCPLGSSTLKGCKCHKCIFYYYTIVLAIAQSVFTNEKNQNIQMYEKSHLHQVMLKPYVRSICYFLGSRIN